MHSYLMVETIYILWHRYRGSLLRATHCEASQAWAIVHFAHWQRSMLLFVPYLSRRGSKQSVWLLSSRLFSISASQLQKIPWICLQPIYEPKDLKKLIISLQNELSITYCKKDLISERETKWKEWSERHRSGSEFIQSQRTVRERKLKNGYKNHNKSVWTVREKRLSRLPRLDGGGQV